MNYLLDTHVVIWAITDDKRLSSKLKTILVNKSNKCFISIVSFWEMGIKFFLGRLELSTDLNEIFDIINRLGIEILPISPNHILENSKLIFHQNDPFDRLLIGQAISENLTILTKDEQFKKYEISIIC